MKTSTGFEYDIQEDALNDMELLEGFSSVQNGGADAVLAMPHIVESLLGSEQKKRLYDHCRNKQGRVPIDAVSAELSEIMNNVSEDKKKSLPSQELEMSANLN